MAEEERIRRRHASEGMLRAYLRLVSCMTREELELSAARLADVLEGTVDPVSARGIRYKREVLVHYLALRDSGRERQSTIRRISHRRKTKSYFTALGNSDFRDAEDAFSEAQDKYAERVAAWSREVRALPFWSRLLRRSTRPSPPVLPEPVEAYVQRSCRAGTLSEYFIGLSTDFDLGRTSDEFSDVTFADIARLTP